MRWYDIKAKDEKAEIWLYDEIGKSWFDDGVTAKEFITELNAITARQIDLRINSPGGQVFEGAAIYNAIKRHPAEITAYIDGIAASIASVIALAGQKLVMADNALFMMHNPSGLAFGTAQDMRDTAVVLDKIRDTMVVAYQRKSDKPQSEIVALLDAESWLNAEEAKSAGFVDEISASVDVSACAKFGPIMAKYGFKHVPEQFAAKKPTARELERILREAGCSVKEAKAILERGLPNDLRDVGPSDAAAPARPALRDVAPPPPPRIDNAARLLKETDALLTGGSV